MPAFLKILGLGLLLSLVGIFLVQRDLRLRMWGVPADALIEGAWQKEGMLGGKEISSVEYTFRDRKDEQFHGAFKPAKGWVPESTTVKIVYLASDPRINRLASDGAVGSYVLLVVGLLLSALGVKMFFSESVVASHKSETPISGKGRIGKAIDRMTD
ncbi:MAG: hypothetical protein KIS92_15380 [Planctomycetota bacterium]|nr:hypothetical protein [Planctomycetota bacterium]